MSPSYATAAQTRQQEMSQYRKKKKRYEKKQAWEAAQYDEPATPDLDYDGATARELLGLDNEATRVGAEANQARQQLYSDTFDPNNPFSSQALLARTHSEQKASTSLGFAGRGSLYSGAHEAQQARNVFSQQRDQDQLYRDYLARMNSVNEGQADAMSDLSMSADDAIFQAAMQQGAADAGTAVPDPRAAAGPKPKGGNKKPKKPKK